MSKLFLADPHPFDRANDIPHDVVLSWEPIEFAQTYDVYIGTDYDAVNDATTTDASYMGRQEANSFDLGRLDFGKKYYWRVDEVNGAPDFSVAKGGVWRFTTEVFSYPIANVTVGASGTFGASVPEHTIDGSGLEVDLHGVSPADMWISTSVQATIEYTFDRAYKLHELWVWNSNQLIESFLGFGAKDLVIEHSLDGENWTVLDGVGPLVRAPGSEDYAHNNTIDLGGATAQHVRLTIDTVQEVAAQASLSEVRFFAIPVYARNPQPAVGSTTHSTDVVLNWHPGRVAASHDVLFSENVEAIEDDSALVVNTTDSWLDLSALDLTPSTTYYWQVDEVNDIADPPVYQDSVWHFTTPETLSAGENSKEMP